MRKHRMNNLLHNNKVYRHKMLNTMDFSVKCSVLDQTSLGKLKYNSSYVIILVPM